MLNVLLINDDQSATLTIKRILEEMNITPIHLVLDEFHPEFLAPVMFDLIIFELFGENRSCVVILKQLEKWAATSGSEVPPVIVITEDDADHIEQDLRTAKVNFFFVKPVSDIELTMAIKQSLLLIKPASLS